MILAGTIFGMGLGYVGTLVISSLQARTQLFFIDHFSPQQLTDGFAPGKVAWTEPGQVAYGPDFVRSRYFTANLQMPSAEQPQLKQSLHNAIQKAINQDGFSLGGLSESTSGDRPLKAGSLQFRRDHFSFTYRTQSESTGVIHVWCLGEGDDYHLIITIAEK
jgi:hypothetical protein